MMLYDLKSIRPKVRGRADFFSWQLYRWLKKHPESYHVYKDQLGRLFVGHQGKDNNWIYGRYLKRLCLYKQSLEMFAMHKRDWDTDEWEEVTEQFWKDYMKKGVCAIHGDKVHNWDTQEDVRTCRYCGKIEHKKIIMVPREVWGDAVYG